MSWLRCYAEALGRRILLNAVGMILVEGMKGHIFERGYVVSAPGEPTGAYMLGDRRLVAVLVWREGKHAPDTIAWLALFEIAGFYVGIHRINGQSHNWVF